MLKEIVAGITDSVGRAALQAAFENGVTTGGFYATDIDEAPPGRPHPYGLEQLVNPERYGPRLMVPHIRVSDATLVFWDGDESPEVGAIRQAVETAGKKILFIILGGNELELPPLVEWFNENNVEVLHIFGIARPVPEYEELHPGVQSFMQELLQELRVNGQLYEPAEGRWLWRGRWHNRSVDAFANFLEDPSEDNVEQLTETTYSLMMGQLVQATRSMPQAALMGPQPGHFETTFAAHEYLCNRLKAAARLNGGLQRRLELLQGYRSSDPDQDFERFVCAITVFHLWKSSRDNADVRRHFSILLRHAFAPHLENSLIQGQRRRHGVENIVDCEEAIRNFLTENEDYLDRFMEKSFNDLRLLLQNRCYQRLLSVYEKRNKKKDFENQYSSDNDYYDPEVDFQVQLVRESRRSTRLILRGIYKTASSTISNCLNSSGRQLFLWMVLGGLSHRTVDRLRSADQRTRYLVQRDFILSLQERNANFVQQWFNAPLQRGADQFRGGLVLAMREAARDFDVDEIYWERLVQVVRKINVWQIFQNLSDYIAEEIRDGRRPGANLEFRQEDWLAKMREFLARNNEDDGAGQIQAIEQPDWFAGFAKFVCDIHGWEQENLEW